MMGSFRLFFNVAVFLFLSCFSPQTRGSTKKEEFSEELLLRPLGDQKVLAHFHFTSTVPSTRDYGRHHRLFPKAIYQLVQKFKIQEMELSFTQGRWNYERWGASDYISSNNAKPPGVELWSVLDVPSGQVDATWKNLTHALSGLFCASINFLESSTSYVAPNWSFRSDITHNLRYGALPREAVCTENLTPWLKLLPCRDKAGIAAIMDRSSIYRGFYHSQRLRISSSDYDQDGESDSGTTLEQTLTIVLQPDISNIYFSGEKMQPSWSIGSLFGKPVTDRCVLAKSSNIFLELEDGLVKKLENLSHVWTTETDVFSEGSWRNPLFELPVSPNLVLKGTDSSNGCTNSKATILYSYSIKECNVSQPLDVGMTWKQPVRWTSCQAPFHASRFLMGSGNARGSMAISLHSTQSHKNMHQTIETVIFQVVPWYVKVYFHSLQIYVDEHLVPFSDVVKRTSVSPSVDRKKPGMMEILIVLPHGTKSATLILDFEKGFLHIDEYPPDANQGFDIPSALISFPGFQSNAIYHEKKLPEKSPLLHKFQEAKSSQLYTEVLLVPLATPDFSMPYNVITLTCTVLALYFGSLLNVLRRRVGEEERFLKNKAAMKGGLLRQLLSKLSARRRQEPAASTSSSPLLGRRKLFKVIVVALFAIGLHFFLNDRFS